MNKQKLISYIQLINTKGIGPISFKKLMDRYSDVDKALSEVSHKKVVFPRKRAEEEVMQAEIRGVKLITLEDKEYPYNLKQIEDCPPILYALGDINILNNSNMLAVVGARNASLSALKMAEKFSGDLSQKDIVIVSGMARGIDTAAHTGALKNNGKTIAVLGTGIDVVYPKENQKIYENLKKEGLILSEFPFHTQPQNVNFPRRNRIVSGLSKGVMVIEASINSGSLITAHCALDQGRDVYAIPGAPYDGRASGCNKLIKDGAILIEKSEDVLENFNYSPIEFVLPPKKIENADLFEYSLDNAENNTDISEQKDEYSKLLSMISESGEEIDELIRAMGLPTEKVLSMIVELELDDKVVRVSGNRIAKT